MECTVGKKGVISKDYLEKVLNEEPTLESRALSLWAVCEKDQSEKNVLEWCKVYKISYAQALELKDYCLALNSKSKERYSRDILR